MAQFKAKVDAGPSQVYSTGKVPPSAATGLVNLNALVLTAGVVTGVVTGVVGAMGVATVVVATGDVGVAETGRAGVTTVGELVAGVVGVIVTGMTGVAGTVGVVGTTGVATVVVATGDVDTAETGFTDVTTVVELLAGGVVATGVAAGVVAEVSLAPPPQADKKVRTVIAAANRRAGCCMDNYQSFGENPSCPKMWESRKPRC